jgi:hypothetical protein
MKQQSLASRAVFEKYGRPHSTPGNQLSAWALMIPSAREDKQVLGQVFVDFIEARLRRELPTLSCSRQAPALDQQQQQHIIAEVCSPPPEGRARWTVRLLTEEVIKRKLVPYVGRETIRVLLESHDLKPWRKKMWCVGKLDEEYIDKM